MGLVRRIFKQQILTRAMCLWVALCFLASSPAFALRSYAPHSGYLESIDGERDSDSKDMVLLQPPPEQGDIITSRIFNDKLNKEFRTRYEQKFGNTEIERVYDSPNRFTYYNDVYGFRGSPQEEDGARKEFGEFMLRRLTEYHVDDYMKSDPKMRPVYDLKERISNVKVEVQKTRFDMAYSLAGNILDVKIINRWLPETKVSFEMNPSYFGPGPLQETELTMIKQVTKTVNVQGHWKFTDAVIGTTVSKVLTPALSTSFTARTFTSNTGISVRESVYLAGLGYSF